MLKKDSLLFIILPAFNEASIIGQVLNELISETKKFKDLKTEIVVIDDGSWDKTAAVSRSKGVVVLSHLINRGLGGALATGIEYAKLNKADFVITFDADGQHDPKDINRVLAPLLNKLPRAKSPRYSRPAGSTSLFSCFGFIRGLKALGIRQCENKKADVVIGIRDKKKMPWDRRIVTIFSSILTLVFFGHYCSDTQSGFRAFNKKALDRIRIRTQRMEVASELFGEIKEHNLRLIKIPIRVIYTLYSRQKGQKNVNALKILIKLVLRLFR